MYLHSVFGTLCVIHDFFLTTIPCLEQRFVSFNVRFWHNLSLSVLYRLTKNTLLPK